MAPSYRLTPRALEDLKSIGRYTLQQWGKKQRDKYLRELDARFAQLAENPRVGKQRPEVAEDYYSFPHGSHVVFYLINEDVIDIIGIPHKHADIILYFDSDL